MSGGALDHDPGRPDGLARPEERDDDVEPLLHFLRDRRGFDFTGYKRPSLTRRIRKRMGMLGVATFSDYVAVLESQPAEFNELFDAILINVTGFMRDPEAWDRIRADILPGIAQRADESGREIRIWSAGCASGEEAYTLAVLAAEAVGEERFRSSVKIYATDADENALREARLARYPYRALVEAFGERTTDQYFEPGSSECTFRSDLRRSVIFGRHDLVQDPPISRIDLLVCRNTLMYFNADIQQRILASFHFSLVDGGYLFLGKAESLAARSRSFTSVDLKRHIFVKQASTPPPRPPLPAPMQRGAAPDRDEAAYLVESAFESSPTAQLAVGRDGVLLAANRTARSLFGLRTHQVGLLLRDLEVSYRPLELRAPIEESMITRRPAAVAGVEYKAPHGGASTYDVVVQPVEDGGAILGVAVTFLDVTRSNALQEELEQSHHELEVAHEELQSAAEELETTNEELQSTNEELETTNEELHSTNEELETINEELQSTNEELETVNEQLRRSTEQTHAANHFLEAVLGGIFAGVVVLGPDLSVRAWNSRAEGLWGLRSDEVVGRHFLNLDIGLPVDRLRAPIRAALGADGTPQRQVLPAVNRRGKSIQVAVTITQLEGRQEPEGVILLMEEVDNGGEKPAS